LVVKQVVGGDVAVRIVKIMVANGTSLSVGFQIPSFLWLSTAEWLVRRGPSVFKVLDAAESHWILAFAGMAWLKESPLAAAACLAAAKIKLLAGTGRWMDTGSRWSQGNVNRAAYSPQYSPTLCFR
jgi:hypothetical protein